MAPFLIKNCSSYLITISQEKHDENKVLIEPGGVSNFAWDSPFCDRNLLIEFLAKNNRIFAVDLEYFVN
jgi:hypothetical protein